MLYKDMSIWTSKKEGENYKSLEIKAGGIVMKRKTKVAAVVLCISMLLCTGCKSSAVKNAEELISGIGEVTLESKDAIEAAQDSYDALGEEQAKVENLQILQEAEEKYDSILHDEVSPIEEAIAAIPQPVTSEAADLVSKADSLYNRAKEPVREAVTNIDILNDAKKTLEDIKVQAAIDAIDQIGTVTLESQSVIDEASTAYQAVATTRRGDVTNYNVLTDATSTLNQLKAEAKEAAGKAAVAKLKTEKDEVENITWYYPTSYPTYSNTRCFVLPYIGRKEDHYWLRCKVDYAADDWVFFQEIVINIDGEKRDTISFDYGDVVRDTAWGAKLYEAADFAPNSSQIELLNDIADSERAFI